MSQVQEEGAAVIPGHEELVRGPNTAHKIRVQHAPNYLHQRSRRQAHVLPTHRTSLVHRYWHTTTGLAKVWHTTHQ